MLHLPNRPQPRRNRLDQHHPEHHLTKGHTTVKPPTTHFNNPHHAARAALGRYGWAAPQQAITDIVAAVFSAADGLAAAESTITPEAWNSGIVAIRAGVRRGLRRDLDEKLTELGAVAVGLPREHRTMTSMGIMPDPAGPDAWQDVEEPFSDDATDDAIGQHLKAVANHSPWIVLRLRLWALYRVPGRWTE